MDERISNPFSTIISQDPNIHRYNEGTQLCIRTNDLRSKDAIISARQLPAAVPVSVPGDSDTSGSKTTQENLSPFSLNRKAEFSTPPDLSTIPVTKSFSKNLKETNTPSPEKRSVETDVESTPTKKSKKTPESHSGKPWIEIESSSSNSSPPTVAKASYEFPTNLKVQLFKAEIQKSKETEFLNSSSTLSNTKKSISRKIFDESQAAEDSFLYSFMTPSSAVSESPTNLPTQVDVENYDESSVGRSSSYAPASKSHISAAVGFKSSIKVKNDRNPVSANKTQQSSKGADLASEIQIAILKPRLPSSCHLSQQRTEITDVPRGMLEFERSRKTMRNDQNRSSKSTQSLIPVTESRSQPENMSTSRTQEMRQRSLSDTMPASKYSSESYHSNMLHRSDFKISSLSCTSGMSRRSGSEKSLMSRNLTEGGSLQNRHDSFVTTRPKIPSSSMSLPEIPNVTCRENHIVQSLNQKLLQEIRQDSNNRSEFNTSSAMSNYPSTAGNDPGIRMPLSRSDSPSRRSRARFHSGDASTPSNPKVSNDPNCVSSRKSRARHRSSEALLTNEPVVENNVNSTYINLTEGQAFKEIRQGSNNRSEFNTSSAMSNSPSTAGNDPGIRIPLNRSDSPSRRSREQFHSSDASTLRNRPGVANYHNDALSQRYRARHHSSEAALKNRPEVASNVHSTYIHITNEQVLEKYLREICQRSNNRSKLNTSSAMSNSPSTTKNDPGIRMPLSRSDTPSRRSRARFHSVDASTLRNGPGVVIDSNDALSQRKRAIHHSEEASTARNPQVVGDPDVPLLQKSHTRFHSGEASTQRNPEVVNDPNDALSRRSRARHRSSETSSKNRPEMASNVNSTYSNVSDRQTFTSSYLSTVKRNSSLAEISTSKNHSDLINSKNLVGRSSSSMCQPTDTRNSTSDETPSSRYQPEMGRNIDLPFINVVEGQVSVSRFQPLDQSFFPTKKNEPAIQNETNFPVFEGESSAASGQPLLTGDISDCQLDSSDDFHPGGARESSHGTSEQHPSSLADKHPEYVTQAQELLKLVLKELMFHKGQGLLWNSFESSFRRISESRPMGLTVELSDYLINKAFFIITSIFFPFHGK